MDTNLRALVEERATLEPYGGGLRATIRVGESYVSALDGFGGQQAALDRLALEVESFMFEGAP